MLLCLVTGLFSLALLLNQRLTLPDSECSIVRNTCGVPSTAVFFSEFTECFPGVTFKYFLKYFVTIQWLQLLAE